MVRDATSESSDSDDITDDVVLRPPKVPSGKSSPSQIKRTTKPSKSSSASTLTNIPLKSAPLISGNNAVPTSKTAKRTSVEKKEPAKLFPESDSSSSEDDPLLAGIPKPVAMDTRTNHAHIGGASLEDLFDEPAGSDGLNLLGNSKEGNSSSDESIGSPEVVLPRGLGLMNIDEDVISGTALEQLSKVS